MDKNINNDLEKLKREVWDLAVNTLAQIQNSIKDFDLEGVEQMKIQLETLKNLPSQINSLSDEVNLTKEEISSLKAQKVDKVEGMSLSSNDFTSEEKLKLSQINTEEIVNTTQSQEVSGEKFFNDGIYLKGATDLSTTSKACLKAVSENGEQTYFKLALLNSATSVFNCNGFLFRNTGNLNYGISISPSTKAISGEQDNYISLGKSDKRFKDLFLCGNLSDGENSISVKKISYALNNIFVLQGTAGQFGKIFQSDKTTGSWDCIDLVFMISDRNSVNVRTDTAIYHISYMMSGTNSSRLTVNRVAGTLSYDSRLYVNYVSSPYQSNSNYFEIYYQSQYTGDDSNVFTILSYSSRYSVNQNDFVLYKKPSPCDEITNLGTKYLFSDIVTSEYIDSSSNQIINGKKSFINDLCLMSQDDLDKSLSFSKSDGSTIFKIRGSISTENTVVNSNAIYLRNLSNSNTGIVINPDNYIYTESDNKIDLGTSSKRFKNLYIAGSISDGTKDVSVENLNKPNVRVASTTYTEPIYLLGALGTNPTLKDAWQDSRFYFVPNTKTLITPNIGDGTTSIAIQTIASKLDIPKTLSQLSGDSTHRLVTDIEKQIWSNKVDYSSLSTVATTGDYSDLENRPFTSFSLEDGVLTINY